MFLTQSRNIKALSILVSLLLLIALLAFSFSLDRSSGQSPKASAEPNPIPRENQLPGTRAWLITNPAPYDATTHRAPGIEGYASATSVSAGDILSFSVSTTQPHFTVNIYRLGWYQGLGGRLLRTIPNLQGHFYPMPPMDPQTGLVDANWPASFTLKIDPGWVTGMYVAKFTAANGLEGCAPFVVRSTRLTTFAFIHGDSTDQAYNPWGGKSLYEFNSTGQKRAYKVSFNRPLLDQAGFGNLLYWEYPMIRWLEKNGYDIGFLSTEDIHSDGAPLKNYKGILIVGHNEYWSKQMRDNLESAVQSGVNLAAFAGDTMGWQIRYEPSVAQGRGLANRIIVCFKDSSLDPLSGKVNNQVTVSFKDRLIRRPTQSLLGEMSGGNFDVRTSYDWVVADASSWIFIGTGLKNGDHLPGLVGYEYDKVFTGYPTPSGLDILASSPVHRIQPNAADIANATLYRASSGAQVFDAGTIHWSWGLDPFNYVDGHKIGRAHV